MTRDEAIEALKSFSENGDPEIAHLRADVVLCELLRTLGYGDVVEAFERVPKWYA